MGKKNLFRLKSDYFLFFLFVVQLASTFQKGKQVDNARSTKSNGRVYLDSSVYLKQINFLLLIKSDKVFSVIDLPKVFAELEFHVSSEI